MNIDDEIEEIATRESLSKIIDNVIFFAMVKAELDEEQTYNLVKKVLKQLTLTEREYEYAIEYTISQLDT